MNEQIFGRSVTRQGNQCTLKIEGKNKLQEQYQFFSEIDHFYSFFISYHSGKIIIMMKLNELMCPQNHYFSP